MNSIMERRIGSCRRELLDRTLIWNQRHLMTVLREYEDIYNTHRPHRTLNQAAPLRPLSGSLTDLDHFRVRRRDRAGGVIREYHLVAWVFGTRNQGSLARDKSTHHAHPAVSQRKYIHPADHGIAGRAEPPRLGGGVGTDVRWAVLLQHEVRRSVVKNLLNAVAESLPPHDFGF
jgi:Integrase core domain